MQGLQNQGEEKLEVKDDYPETILPHPTPNDSLTPPSFSKVTVTCCPVLEHSFLHNWRGSIEAASSLLP